MHSATQPHYYDTETANIVQQQNGGDFITIIIIGFIMMIICAFPTVFINHKVKTSWVNAYYIRKSKKG